MSVVPVPSVGSAVAAESFPPERSRRWIINAWLDQLLIVSTPLLVIPAVLALNSPLGINAETISLVVTSFFALGHHLPGLIRAYGDPELFQRFRWRFLLAPPLLFLAYFPLQKNHPAFFPLVVVFWATWHGLMQLYGFVRIYDARVGSVSRATAHWDWLVCLSGFVAAQAFSSARMSDFLRHWYSFGGPLIAPEAILAGRWCLLAVFLVAIVGFAVNYARQLRHGPKPNPVKLLLLVSGIGTWWTAVVFVENAILGVALFDICHDVQYLAIVWMFNCGRVRSNPAIGRFMSYVFRRGMVLLYVGLVAAYGAIGLMPSLVEDGTVILVFNGILGTSTLLHYYYDGFIWKVREKETQVGLGLNSGGVAAPQRSYGTGLTHLLKWSPLIVMAGWLCASDLFETPSLAQSRKAELDKRYAGMLLGAPVLPSDDNEQSWLYEQFERVQSTAAAVPGDRTAQLRAAVMLANFGRLDEAVTVVEKLLTFRPADSEAQMVLGGIRFQKGELEQALDAYRHALAQAKTKAERSSAALKLGEVHLRRNADAEAEAAFEEALRDNPGVQAAIDVLRKSHMHKSHGSVLSSP